MRKNVKFLIFFVPVFLISIYFLFFLIVHVFLPAISPSHGYCPFYSYDIVFKSGVSYMDMIETVQESGVTKLDLNSKPYVGYYGKFIKISDQIPTKTKEKILQDLSHDRRTLQYDQIKEEINMDPTVSDDEIRTMINQIASIKNSDIIIREVKMVKIEGGQLRPEIKDKFIHSPQIESIRGGEMCAL